MHRKILYRMVPILSSFNAVGNSKTFVCNKTALSSIDLYLTLSNLELSGGHFLVMLPIVLHIACFRYFFLAVRLFWRGCVEKWHKKCRFPPGNGFFWTFAKKSLGVTFSWKLKKAIKLDFSWQYFEILADFLDRGVRRNRMVSLICSFKLHFQHPLEA